MQFPPDHYLEASRERLTDAARLHAAQRFVASVYLSGVAVECMLRAYRGRELSDFESRHDLKQLMAESGVLSFIRDAERRDFAAHLATVWSFWRNNLRYAEQSRFDSWVRSIHPQRRSEAAGWASAEVYRSADYVVTRGVLRWNSPRD